MRTSKYLIVAAITALALVAGCAHKKAKEDTSSNQKQEKTEQKEEAKIDVMGTPAPGSKFSKLKAGMTMKEVFAKIGAPDNQWQRPTGKASIPFYFGPDRWVIECVYKKEGKLTFNAGEEQLLTNIEVNTAE